jgi:hypothetical protein
VLSSHAATACGAIDLASQALHISYTAPQRLSTASTTLCRSDCFCFDADWLSAGERASMAHLEHNWTAPQPATNPTITQAHSPNAPAAAVTLATLSDSRPPTSHGDHEEAGEDDDSGGISLADYQQFMDAAPEPQPMEEGEDTTSVNAQMQALQQEFMSQIHTSWAAHHFESSTSTLDAPGLTQYMSAFMSHHLSSSDPLLEPPPAFHEFHLSVPDKGSFTGISTFFHQITPAKPTVPGLDLVQVPTSITREDLQGDKYDCQGIDWSVRNTTRSAVRKKRFEFENAKLQQQVGTQYLKEVRKVIEGLGLSLS